MGLFLGNSRVQFVLNNVKHNFHMLAKAIKPILSGVMLVTSDDLVLMDSNNVWITTPLDSILPSEYQQVDWLLAESNKEAYIDLGFTFDTKARIYLEQYIEDTNVISYPFGAVDNTTTRRCCLHCPYPVENKGYVAHIYGSTSSGFTAVSTSIQTGKNSFVLTYEPRLLQIENLTSETSASLTTQASYTMSANLYLFAQNYDGAPRFGSVRQIGRFQYYDKNDELICDLVPCYRKSDVKIGMYDLARNIFLTTAGKDDFLMGNDD